MPHPAYGGRVNKTRDDLGYLLAAQRALERSSCPTAVGDEYNEEQEQQDEAAGDVLSIELSRAEIDLQRMESPEQQHFRGGGPFFQLWK